MSKREFLYKSIFLLPSIAISVIIFYLFAALISKSGVSHDEWIFLLLSKVTVKVVLKSLVFLFVSLLFSCVLSFIFSLPKHGSSIDIYLSFFHGSIVSLPVFVFLFILVYIFSALLKLLPSQGIFNLISFILPVLGLSIFFALYVSFKIRYNANVDRDKIASKGKKRLYYYFQQLSSEIGIFLSLFFTTEIFFYSDGLGLSIVKAIRSSKIIGLSINLLYISVVFLILRYLFSLFAFFTSYRKNN